MSPGKCTLLYKFPTHLRYSDLQELLSTIDKLQVCAGHPDQHFVQFIEEKSRNTTAILDRSGVFVMNGCIYDVTVRSTKCEVLTTSLKCSQCVTYRNTLRTMYHRWNKRTVPSSSSHTNDRWLTPAEKDAKSTMLRQRAKSAESALRYMKKKIEISNKKLGVEVDDDLHGGLQSILSENSSSILEKYPEGSFHHLFWNQQVKALSTSPKQCRWHPMLIRWCLHLKMLSSAAYDSLRGILRLPCGRTLQDYTRSVE